MIEIAAAALAPALGLVVIAFIQRDAPFRRAVLATFVPMTLIWFAPYWLTGRTPTPLQYLFAQIAPWKSAGPVPSAFLTRNVLMSDVVTQFLPWREVVSDSWRRGELPLLNPFAGAGSPLWANPQAAVLAPVTLLGLPFSTFAWPLFAAVLKMLTALTGTYLFLRAEGRSDAAARFGAVAYGFCGFAFAFMLFPLTNVTTLLPWMLLAIRRVAEERWSGVVFAAGITTLLLVAGHPESVLHTAFIAVPYAIARMRTRRALMLTCWSAFIGLLLAAPVVLPFLEIMRLTERAARGASFFRSPALTLTNLLAFIFPAHFEYSALRSDGVNFSEHATQYAGFATLVLALFAAFIDAKRQRFWIVLFAILGISAFDVMPLGVPVLHGRVRFVLAFITAVVGAAGFDLISARPRVLRVVAPAMLVIALIAAGVFWPTYVNFQITSIVIASLVAITVTAAVITVPRLRGLLTLLLFVDLAVVGMTSHQPADRSLLYPPRPVLDFLRRQPQPFRFVGLEGTLFPNTSAMFGLEDIRVHDPVALEPYAAELERGGYDRSQYFEVFRRLPAHELADRLGVRYIVAPPDARGALPPVYRGTDAVVYLNPTARPRFWSDGGEAVQVRRAEATVSEVIVSGSRATSVRSGIAALPGWRLERNGVPSPLAERSGLLEWLAPAGRNVFVLRYRPAGLNLGIVLSGLGIMLLLHAVWLSAITRSSSASAG